MYKAIANINKIIKEVYPEFWIMSNSSELLNYLNYKSITSFELFCPECGKEVSICSLGDGRKKEPYFAHKRENGCEVIPDCSLRSESEKYDEIYKFRKPRSNQESESALHREMKRYAISKFWAKENKYIVKNEDDVITYNRFENTKFRSDLLIEPLIGETRSCMRSEQFIFEGQTHLNSISVKHIEKAIEYKKVGFLEENIVNAYSLEHLNKATYISNNYEDIVYLQSLKNSEVDRKIKLNAEKNISIIDKITYQNIESLSGYYAFHGDAEFLYELKNYSNNQLLFMYIPITRYKDKDNEVIGLNPKDRNKRRLILASVLDTITIKENHSIVAYLYFNDISHTSDINEYKEYVKLHNNRVIEFCQTSLKDLSSKYIKENLQYKNEVKAQLENIINMGNSYEKEISDLKVVVEKQNSIIENKDKVISELENEVNLLKDSNDNLESDLERKKNGIALDIKSEIEPKIIEELNAKFKFKLDALGDGHRGACNRANCEKAHRKEIINLKGNSANEISVKIKCPLIDKIQLDEYFKIYDELKQFKCVNCPKNNM